jgi:hypothetical protein
MSNAATGTELAGAVEADDLFGHINDAIRSLARDDSLDETWQFICECPDVTCHAFVDLTLKEFDARRSASPPSPILSSIHDD